MINQVTVFLENREGRLAALCRCLSDAHINMYALTIADTTDYGVVRIICNDPARAIEVLNAADFRALSTKVAAIQVPNRPGGLAELLETLDKLQLNIEYGYCFSYQGEQAIDVLKIADADLASEAAATLEAAGFKPLQPADLA